MLLKQGQPLRFTQKRCSQSDWEADLGRHGDTSREYDTTLNSTDSAVSSLQTVDARTDGETAREGSGANVERE